MGAPLTLGFLGRWRLIEAGVGAGWWWATGAAIITSLAAVFYGGRLIERLYFRRATEASNFDVDAWRLARAPVMVAALVAVACGVAPAWMLDLAQRAAMLALGLTT
jgi:NADH:ubiquinone oxidoreductase subunit 2 (subunit N)